MQEPPGTARVTIIVFFLFFFYLLIRKENQFLIISNGIYKIFQHV